MEKIIEIENLDFAFENNMLFRDANLTICKGDYI